LKILSAAPGHLRQLPSNKLVAMRGEIELPFDAVQQRVCAQAPGHKCGEVNRRGLHVRDVVGLLVSMNTRMSEASALMITRCAAHYSAATD